MNRKAIVAVISVFVLGLVMGGLATYAWVGITHGDGGKRNTPQDVVARLNPLLDLTPAQQEQILAILTDTKGQFDATYGTIRPQMDAIRQQGRRSIRAILTPEQLPKFEEHLRQLDEQRKQREKEKGR